uniref:Neurexin-3-like n=1 Tax=Phallusia mammillata TaxID=59560 RepID=A0A6F9DN92_9ASCI|nr:neurexin-3-like [Phallusia mammillata]
MTPRSLTIWYRFDCLILVLLSTIVTSSFGAWDLDSELSLSVTGPQRQTFTPSGNSSLIAGDLVRMTTFHFSGNTGQYAEFPTWKTPIDGNMALSFQFRTKLGDAFLMYLDDGDSSFIAITLYQRSLRLRFKFGLPRTVVLTLGNNMNDNRWHTVQVEKSFPSVRFTVDGNVTSQSVRGEGQDLISTTPTFFGGLTGGYEISQLALPSVFFENRFSGYVRQISINGKYVSAVRKYDVLEQTLDDACTEFRNPCQNNGVCYVSDQDTSCDCSGTSFAGQYCEEPLGQLMMADAPAAYNQAVATFTGEEWFKYELSNRAVSTFQDKISLFFRTTQPNGLLFHTGKSADFVSLSLANGIVQVALNLGAGAYTIDVEKPNSVFNDDKWHRVQVNRSLSEKGDAVGPSSTVRVIVDDIDLLNNMEQEDFRELTLDNAIYVGGSPDTANLPGTQFSNTNFVGCLKEVTYVSDRGIPLAISRMAESRHPDVIIHGDVDFTCTPTNLSLPVSFARPESYITIPSWSSKTKGSIEFNFRTKEQNGLLIFGQGNASDLFAVEMYRGQLALVIDLGSQTARFLSYSTNRMYDGKWHHVRIIRMGRKIVFNVDGVKKQHMILGTSTDLDLSSSMTVGGSDFGSGFQQLRGLFTSPKRQGFVGCIQNMIIDKDIVDLRSLAQSSGQNMGPSSLGSGDITAFCGGLDGSKCASNPCMNGARCTEGMNRFICDCSNTSYRGKTCENAVMSATFDGTQYMGFEMEKSIQTDGEDISMRFKTPLKSGVLFATVSRSTRDMMRIEMEGGRLKLTIDLDCSQPNCTAPRSGPDTMYSETMLNDRKWHSVKLTRRGHRITFGVDGRHKGKTLGGRYTKLEFDAIYLGRIVDSNTTQAFAGTLQNVVFNSNFLIDSCFNQGIPCNHNVTWGERYAVAKPVTFRGSDSYIAMNTLSAYRTMSIFLSIKTTVTDGLILYNGGNSGDFMAVEIYGGKLMYIFNLGNGPQVLTVNGDLLVNDNSWHDIRIERSEDNIHTLTVDKQQVIQGGRVGNKNLDLGGKFYIGGVPGNMYQYELPDRVASRTGYEGCMGSLEVNGVSQDMRDPRGKQTVGKVNPGCLKPSPACTPTTCSNDGVCIQHWDGFKCDCSLTSYVGRLCQQHVSTLPEGHSYRIGSGTGLILYKWRDDYPSTRTDKLGLGFSTSLRNCVLLRVSGYTNPPTQDYLQLSIENGKLTLRFNVGGGRTVELREERSVSDGSYHTVQVRRRWLNATMRVNNWPVRSITPSGDARSRFALASPSIAPSARPAVDSWLQGKERVASVFNSQSTIQIGGLLSESAMSTLQQPTRNRRSPDITQPFVGQMMGLFFNDVRVFDLAARNDDRVQFYGDVTKIGGPDISPTNPTISQPTTTMATLTIFSTTKSTPFVPNGSDPDDCDDEDMCPNSSGEHTDQQPSYPIPTTAAADWTGSAGSDRTLTSVPVSTGSIRFDQAKVTSSPPPPNPPMTPRRSSTQPPAAFSVTYESNSSATSAPLPSVFVTNDVTETRSGGGAQTPDKTKRIKIPISPMGDNIINTSNTSSSPLDVTVDVGSNVTNSVYIGQATTVTTAMIAGIAAAAACCVLLLFYVMYRFKKRDSVTYNVDERERQYGAMPKKGKPVTPIKNGSMKRDAKSQKHDKDKEYYV